MTFGHSVYRARVMKLQFINARQASSYVAILKAELSSIEEAGTWKHERIIASSQRTRIMLNNGSEVLNFCANNYLGLSVSIQHLSRYRDCA